MAKAAFGLELLGEAKRASLAVVPQKTMINRLLTALEPFEIRMIMEAWNMKQNRASSNTFSDPV